MSNYAAASDLYDCFGKANVKEWANMEELSEDSSEYSTAVNNRITAALTYATAEIDDYLRNGPYEIPFTTVPESIKRVCVYLAGAWLFEWRRDTEENDRYEKMDQRGRTILEEIKRGVRQFDETVQTVKGERNPYVVKV